MEWLDIVQCKGISSIELIKNTIYYKVKYNDEKKIMMVSKDNINFVNKPYLLNQEECIKIDDYFIFIFENFEYSFEDIQNNDIIYSKIDILHKNMKSIFSLFEDIEKDRYILKSIHIHDIVFCNSRLKLMPLVLSDNDNLVSIEKLETMPSKIEPWMIDPFLHFILADKYEWKEEYYYYNMNYMMIYKIIECLTFPKEIKNTTEIFYINQSFKKYQKFTNNLTNTSVYREYHDPKNIYYRKLRMICQIVILYFFPICFDRSITKIKKFWNDIGYMIDD